MTINIRVHYNKNMKKLLSQNVTCKICNKKFPTLVTHIIKMHKTNTRDYLKRFPGSELTSKEYRERVRNSMKNRFIEDPTLRGKVASRTFDFIKNKKLTPLLQRDYKDAKICLEKSLWKPSILLYGSIIEAILLEKHLKEKKFYNVIDIAYKDKEISENEMHKIHIIRDLRNYVHIHKELAGNGEINEHWANTAADICESIIKRFRKI
jgi:hypothetical protein